MKKKFKFNLYKLTASLFALAALLCVSSISEIKAQNKIITDFPIVENFFCLCQNKWLICKLLK